MKARQLRFELLRVWENNEDTDDFLKSRFTQISP